MATRRAYLYLNSMLLTLTALKNEQTGALLDNGSGVTVTAKLVKSEDDTLITGSEITLSYSGTPGKWTGIYPAGVGVTLGLAIDAVVTIDGGGPSAQGLARVPCWVQQQEVA